MLQTGGSQTWRAAFVIMSPLWEANPMNLSELSKAMTDFVDGQGWTRAESPRPQTARNLAISLCLEAAEVLEHYQWQAEADDRGALAAELADVALYLLQLAKVCNIDLEQAILAKLKINAGRQWE
jgi:NTP pyrophosphatase (non-canonical NTP hydrolase)